MNHRLSLRPTVAVWAALVLLTAGGAVTYVVMRSLVAEPPASGQTAAGGQATPASPIADAFGQTARLRPDVTVSIPSDQARRAGIVVVPATSAGGSGSLRLPGVVEPNAYRQVVVSSLVSGRVAAVITGLGATVSRGQQLARIQSADLAEAEQRLVSASAMLDAHDKELKRTEKLASIGAASRQEVERIHAEHASQTAEVDSARARVRLLGGFPEASAASADEVPVAAPIDGVVTQRYTNVGENVEPATKLFTVVDLSSVWVVGDVFERDFASVRIGDEVVVTAPSLSGFSVPGAISYLDPQVNPATRTGRIRVELANPRHQLRLGTYVDLTLRSRSVSGSVLIPRSAVQSVGDGSVVYLAAPNRSGSFIEREVRLGDVVGNEVEVLEGVAAGDSVVTEGSFSLRAEVERAGLRGRDTIQASAHPAAAAERPTGQSKGAPQPQTASVTASEKGFDPSALKLRAGVPARVTFKRTTDKTCATAVVFPSLKIKRDLPLNQLVDIDFTPQKGELTFACGMNMFKGTIVAQ